ncbi:23S rRNA (adenine(1618)-N(6))-methyltransferase RlmF [uncultured Dokdonia sp.]|uniref:23S rRNA (adenine(1618)-N(6))-methyltransferase RlmF n=1 Tax=uncultured Dokdonia sp. TaxID=575653 RepID=UPI00263795F3|nr:23S rRNA (adenine(1618)-N(6))-methyltransferase RlmF [uncultured Dokdonia sp.]
MHPNNLHNTSYDFESLQKSNSLLKEYVFVNEYNIKTIDFSNALAVKALNKALLSQYYNINNWDIPDGYLCPPIPNRVDYIHYIAGIIKTKEYCRGLDIGVGANCIYPLLATQIYKWHMVGADISKSSVAIAKQNATEASTDIEIRLQEAPAHIFKGIIQKDEYFDFTMCNPPFYTSAKDAQKANTQKNKKLQLTKATSRNFGGVSNELWCNGGEALFVKRMIKQSVDFKDQVGIFTTLISKKENLPKLLKQLQKLTATHQVIEMHQGHKKSRILTWYFPT